MSDSQSLGEAVSGTTNATNLTNHANSSSVVHSPSGGGAHSPSWSAYLSPSLGGYHHHHHHHHHHHVHSHHGHTSDLRSTSRPSSPAPLHKHSSHDNNEKQKEINLFEQSFGGDAGSSGPMTSIEGASRIATLVAPMSTASGTMTPGRVESKLRNNLSSMVAADDDEDELLDDDDELDQSTTMTAVADKHFNMTTTTNVHRQSDDLTRDDAAAAAAAALVGAFSHQHHHPSMQSQRVSRPALKESFSSELSIATSAASISTKMTSLTTPDRSPPIGQQKGSTEDGTKPTSQPQSLTHDKTRMSLDLRGLSTFNGRTTSSGLASPSLPSLRNHLLATGSGSGMRTPDYVLHHGSMTPNSHPHHHHHHGAMTPSYLTSSLTRLVDEPEKVLSPPLVVDLQGGYMGSTTTTLSSSSSGEQTSTFVTTTQPGIVDGIHVMLPSLPRLPQLTTSVTTTKTQTNKRRGRKSKIMSINSQDQQDELGDDDADDQHHDDDDDEYMGPGVTTTLRSTSRVRRGGGSTASSSVVNSPRVTTTEYNAVDRNSMPTTLEYIPMKLPGLMIESSNGNRGYNNGHGGIEDDDGDAVDFNGSGTNGGTSSLSATKLSALERNRIAASKSRKRKRERMQNMEQIASDLSNQNASLQSTASQLKSELFALRSQLSTTHPDLNKCKCQHVQAYLSRERQGHGIQMILQLSGSVLDKQYGDVGKWGRGGGADVGDVIRANERLQDERRLQLQERQQSALMTNDVDMSDSGEIQRGTKRTRAAAATARTVVVQNGNGDGDDDDDEMDELED
ncbi:hypothetical protein OIO90_004275 [Microbotryomycetes sp. JL221]|nr:hypothetical protein OIO90_004275 [Microbotryomycetes sp. JL221]